LAALCKFAQRNSLSGAEFAWGIPGSVGGAAFMNAGAYEGQFSDILVSTTHVTTTGRTDSLLGPEMEMDYRKSAYLKNNCIITSIVVRLEPGNKEQISMQMDDYFSRRKEKQPLEQPSAGSIFKRPDGAYAGALIEEAGLKGEKVGGAMVSEKHAGFIVNNGGATCSDVKALIEKIQETVLKKSGVSLECEVRFIS
jgi:UDP-N-acetylmuramate dehydrogenase